MFGCYHHNRAKQAYKTVHHHIHATLQDGLRSSLWRLRLSFSAWDADCWRRRRHIGPVTMSVVGKPMNTLAPIVSRSQLFQGQSRTLLSSHILQVSDEKQIESVAVSVTAGPANYIRRVTAELFHPDRASHRQRSVHTRRQGHVCSLDRLITPLCPKWVYVIPYLNK